MQHTSNPLSAFFRSKELATPLPSRGLFYTSDIVEMEPDDELDVFAMTAKDELYMKNPDALLNGNAVADLIKSCVPAVKQPKLLLQTDVDALLVAIYGASNGNIDVTAKCNQCGTTCDGTIPAEDILGTMTVVKEKYEFTHKSGLKFAIKPYSYQAAINAGMIQFRSTQSLRSLGDIEDDIERMSALSESIGNIAALEFELIVDSVASVELPSEDHTIVTDKRHILEFFENCGKDIANHIQSKIKEVNSLGVNKEMKMICEKCSITEEQIKESNEERSLGGVGKYPSDQKPTVYTFDTIIELNPINFFIAS